MLGFVLLLAGTFGQLAPMVHQALMEVYDAIGKI
jgi:hypothetical protein